MIYADHGWMIVGDEFTLFYGFFFVCWFITIAMESRHTGSVVVVVFNLMTSQTNAKKLPKKVLAEICAFFPRLFLGSDILKCG